MTTDTAPRRGPGRPRKITTDEGLPTPTGPPHGRTRVWLHNAIGSIFAGGTTISRSDGTPEGDERTWWVDIPTEDAQRAIRDCEWVATNAGAVPLTLEEQHAADDLKSHSQVEVSRMAAALAELAAERAKARE